MPWLHNPSLPSALHRHCSPNWLLCATALLALYDTTPGSNTGRISSTPRDVPPLEAAPLLPRRIRNSFPVYPLSILPALSTLYFSSFSFCQSHSTLSALSMIPTLFYILPSLNVVQHVAYSTICSADASAQGAIQARAAQWAIHARAAQGGTHAREGATVRQGMHRPAWICCRPRRVMQLLRSQQSHLRPPRSGAEKCASTYSASPYAATGATCYDTFVVQLWVPVSHPHRPFQDRGEEEEDDEGSDLDGFVVKDGDIVEGVLARCGPPLMPDA